MERNSEKHNYQEISTVSLTDQTIKKSSTKKKTFKLILVFAILVNYVGYQIIKRPIYTYEHSIPRIITYALWPLPADRQVDPHQQFYLHPSSFEFQIIGEVCNIFEDAVARYKKIILEESKWSEKLFFNTSSKNHNSNFKNLLRLKIHLTKQCEFYPHLHLNESYTLNIPDRNNHSDASLTADSIWGILRGLETFSQLINLNDSKLTIGKQRIQDVPRFQHRGLIVDTSTHFVPIEDFLNILDTMSYNKLNVLHWHIVGNDSFPFHSSAFPELSVKGAYDPGKVYSTADVQRIIEYARLRGIRVVPEFNTPGHTKSWGQAFPEYLTSCFDADGNPTGKLGPMNPTDEQLYKFLTYFFFEIMVKFPDSYVHLGGDEVPYDCWKNNPEIKLYMKKNNISGRYDELQGTHTQRLFNIAYSLFRKPIVYQEAFDNKVTLKEDTIVQIWKGNWTYELAKITEDRYLALLSSCWCLDHLDSNDEWLKYYECDPLSFSNIEEQQEKLLGGETCMWTGSDEKQNINSRTWLRIAAVAEKLWTGKSEDENSARDRLEKHFCRLNRRNISIEPLYGPESCVSFSS